ncbi:hypothetical protein MAR_002968 [Mya arenaria]|uniref:Uncharacterized protein n=1 Tax=Mya arenaria TaxID=6604 RepID=A0ABY7G5G2_MYAAR|nr:hypothetical protein MAR_002968 [Mya arenaria]
MSTQSKPAAFMHPFSQLSRKQHAAQILFSSPISVSRLHIYRRICCSGFIAVKSHSREQTTCLNLYNNEEFCCESTIQENRHEANPALPDSVFDCRKAHPWITAGQT